MKAIKLLSLSFLLVFFLGQVSFAQKTGTKEVKFLTSAHCGSCKTTIEGALGKLPGVSSSDLNLEDKVVTVKYDAAKTNPDAMKGAIVKAGYKADLYTATTTKGKENCKEKKNCNEKGKKCNGDKKA